jgi:hypothetical protein
MMQAPESRWSAAFLRQARSDLDAYELLVRTDLAACHRLHSLQMWLEKLCKAYLWSEAITERSNLPDFKTSHKVVEKVLPSLIRQHWRQVGYRSIPDHTEIRDICREIDRLHPQIGSDGVRPENVEYPWPTLRAGKPHIAAPADQRFPVADRISKHTGRQVVKAATVLTRSDQIWTPGESH